MCRRKFFTVRQEKPLTRTPKRTSKIVFLVTWCPRIIMDRAAIALLICCAFGCSQSERTNAQTKPFSAESPIADAANPRQSGANDVDQMEIVIMRLALDDLRFNREKGSVLLIRTTSAQPPTQIKKDLRIFGKQNSTLLADFIIRNSIALNFNEHFCAAPSCILKDEEEAKRIFFNDARRTEAAAQFPQLESAVGLSRVAFDVHGTQAVIFARRYSGPRSGLGEYIIFELQGGRWAIQKRIEVWFM